MGDVTGALIRPFLDQYGQPDKPNPTAFLRNYVDIFAEHNDDVLRDAARHVIANRRYSTWPMPGDVTAAIAAVTEERQRRDASARPTQEHDLWTTEPMRGWRESPIDVLTGLFVHVEGGRVGKGLRTINARAWNPRFDHLEIVKLAEAQGWADTLRINVRRLVKRDLRAGVALKDASQYMPTNMAWIEAMGKESADVTE